jgi:UDP-3-O-[3-hydroxymyristoyl] glucosamine N-acyltransferase
MASEIRAAELVAGTSLPAPLAPRGLSARVLADAHGLELVGADRAIGAFTLLSTLRSRCLGYLGSEEWLAQSDAVEEAVLITSAALARRGSRHNSYLITGQDPRDTFYLALTAAICDGRFPRLASHRSPSARIAPSAMLGDNVHVDDDAEIGPNAVVLPNTYVGPNVVIKANATIGGNGFETAMVGGARRIVEHAGGVWLSRGVHVGSATCVDRGLFGDFTVLGEGTLVDNLVHVAHSVRVGRDCSLIACSEVSGSVTLGDGVWVGPSSAINPQVRIGDHAYLGTASIVTRNIPNNALAYGSPAKVHARVCACRRKLTPQDGLASCACGRRWLVSDDGRVEPA